MVFIGEDMKPGDQLFLGVSTETDPFAVSLAHEIKGVTKTPRLRKATEFERRAFLQAGASR